MKRLILGLALLVLAALGYVAWSRLAPEPTSAQAAPSRWFAVTEYDLKPGMGGDFRKFVVDEWNPVAKKGGVTERAFWTVRVGEGNRVVMITTLAGLAQQDEPNAVQKALGNEAPAFVTKINAFLVGTHTYLMRSRPDLSYMPERIKVPRIAELRLAEVAPGRTAEYEAYAKEVAAAAQKSNMGRQVSEVRWGDVRHIAAAYHYDSFADLDKGDMLVRALGEEGAAALTQKGVGLFFNVRYSIIQFEPEMSFRVGPTT